MKLVYTHENIALAQNAKNLLENNDIKAILKNEFSSGAAGDLVPAETWPEIYVLQEGDYSRAVELLAALSDKANEPDWICNICKEPNGVMFESCWRCQTIPEIKKT